MVDCKSYFYWTDAGSMMTFRDQTDHPAYKGIILITLYTKDHSDTCIPRIIQIPVYQGIGARAPRLEQAEGRALRLRHTWEVAAWKIAHLGSCHLITLYTRGSSYHPVYQGIILSPCIPEIILITLCNKEPPDHPVWQGIILIPLYNKGSPWSPLYTRGSPYHPGYL